MTSALLLALALPAAARAPAKTASAPAKEYPLPLYAPTTAQITVPLVVERFTEFDDHLKSMSCSFAQVVRWEESGVAQVVGGTLDYQKPDLLHVDQRSPEPQTMVSDGQWLWIWRRSTDQVIQTKLEDWKRSEPLAESLLEFGNYAGMLKSYDVSVSSVSAPDAKGYRRVELTLRPREAAKSQDFTLLLKMSTKDFFPSETELRSGQVIVRSSFKDVRYNPPIPAERFHFTPPPGADVFQNFKPPKAE